MGVSGGGAAGAPVPAALRRAPTRAQRLSRWLFASFRYAFATAPWFLVVSYFGTCLWASWVLGRPPRYGELDGTLTLELMRLVNVVLLWSVPTVLVYPLVRRPRGWLLDAVAIGGVLSVVVTLVFDIGGYLEWYRD